MTSDLDSRLTELLSFVREGERICPQPTHWQKLWEMLPNRARVGQGWMPPAPLILAAWWHTTDALKQQRLEEHIRYAFQNYAFDAVERFLLGLGPAEWKYQE